MNLKTQDDSNAPLPLMLGLAEPMPRIVNTEVEMGAMTKYKTYNGEEINGQKVWQYDYHDDDD